MKVIARTRENIIERDVFRKILILLAMYTVWSHKKNIYDVSAIIKVLSELTDMRLESYIFYGWIVCADFEN